MGSMGLENPLRLITTLLRSQQVEKESTLADLRILVRLPQHGDRHTHGSCVHNDVDLFRAHWSISNRLAIIDFEYFFGVVDAPAIHHD